MSSPPETVTPQIGSTLMFLAGTLIAAAGLGIVAAQAPDRIRLLVLFALGFGLLLGWLAARMSALLNVPRNRTRLGILAVATLGGLVLTLCQTVALLPTSQPSTKIHPIAALVETQQQRSAEPASDSEPQVILEPIDPAKVPPPPASMAQFQKLRQKSEPQFSTRIQTYLHNRIARGTWPQPWPELFWAGEVVLGMTGAVWMASRCRWGSAT
ncbi:MAG: hypothetical protein JSS49_06475 [Planctomycetes bacterium]|nr:hypothetical protein [Planctomycetota bacterium]